jgi:hypothetical protein
VCKVVHSIGFGARNIDALFLMLRWAQGGSHKNRVGTRDAKLVFLDPMRYAGHVIRSGVSLE